jgi:hypothetical protein
VVLRYSSQRVSLLEPVLGQVLLVLGQVFDGQLQIVRVIEHRHQVARLLEADLLQARLARGLLNALEHAVQNRPSEVSLGVGEPGWIVRARSLAQGEESISL